MVTLADKRAAAHPLARLLGRDAERDERAQPGADGRPRRCATPARRTRRCRSGRSRSRSKEVLRLVSIDPVHLHELPAPALGRDAAAGDDRDGAAVHAGADHHGRADVGPRRRRPALADGADQGAAGAARLRGHLRHARHVARPPLLRPAARDVRGAGGRAGADPAAVRQAAASLHAGPAGGVPVDPRRRRSTCSGSRARRRTCSTRRPAAASRRVARTRSRAATAEQPRLLEVDGELVRCFLHEHAAEPVEARKEGVA